MTAIIRAYQGQERPVEVLTGRLSFIPTPFLEYPTPQGRIEEYKSFWRRFDTPPKGVGIYHVIYDII